MKKRIMNLVLALALTVAGLAGQTTLAQADGSKTDWEASFDGNVVKTNYIDQVNSGALKDKIKDVMPGDTVKYTVGYKNLSGEDSAFYLSTNIINSLEDKDAEGNVLREAKGGGYTYKISYQTPTDAEPVYVYDSELVGGDDKGLNQVNTGKDTYFSIGTLKAGEANPGIVQIEIVLDGNTQDNSYMYKLATLDIRFGAEKVTKATPNVVNNEITKSYVTTVPGAKQVVAIDDPSTPLAVSSTNNPVTGDSIIPLVVCTAGLVVGFMFILMYFIISKKQREEVA